MTENRWKRKYLVIWTTTGSFCGLIFLSVSVCHSLCSVVFSPQPITAWGRESFKPGYIAVSIPLLCSMSVMDVVRAAGLCVCLTQTHTHTQQGRGADRRQDEAALWQHSKKWMACVCKGALERKHCEVIRKQLLFLWFTALFSPPTAAMNPAEYALKVPRNGISTS